MRIPRPHSRLQWAGTILVALFLGANAFYWVAPYNIAASLPHLPGVRWLLHTYMKNAVRTWSAGIEVPEWIDLEDPALIRLGAAHFEGGCAPCHGAPGRLPNPLVENMRPAPPPLQATAEDLKPRELFWIVRHGIKYTGMPAWAGEERDDEPWAVAAFLLKYPVMEPEAYAELAFGPEVPDPAPAAARTASFAGMSEPMEKLTQNCARCHGKRGDGRNGTAPKLAGQSEPYLLETLLAYASDERQSGIMEPLAAPLAPEEIAALAAHYAGMPQWQPDPIDPATAALYALGAELAERGDDDVPSCLSCHGEGVGPPPRPLYPRIAGQSRLWIETWLRQWRERPFGATRYAEVMHAAAEPLDDREIRALAIYFAAGGGARTASAR